MGMQQINHWKTRNENTLDLVFVNETNYIKDLVVYDTGISDHRVIELSIKILSDKLSKDHKIKEWKGYEMYNFYSDKINWKKVNEDLNLSIYLVETVYFLSNHSFKPSIKRLM